MGAVAGHAGGDDPVRGARLEQGQRDLLDHLAGRALAHADGDRPVADGHDVAALAADAAERLALLLAGVPELEVGVPEVGVEAVDRLDVERLEPAGRPVHRVDHDAAVDPGRWVAGEVAVGQRPEDEVVGLHRRDDQRAASRSAPSPTLGTPRLPASSSAPRATVRPPIRWSARVVGVDLVEVGADLVDDAGADRERRSRPGRAPRCGLRVRRAPRASSSSR